MLECPNPEFPWNPECGWFEACIHCRRVAWEHEQSDPMRDCLNMAMQMRDGFAAGAFPPAMLNEEEFMEREKNLRSARSDDKL